MFVFGRVGPHQHTHPMGCDATAGGQDASGCRNRQLYNDCDARFNTLHKVTRRIHSIMPRILCCLEQAPAVRSPSHRQPVPEKNYRHSEAPRTRMPHSRRLQFPLLCQAHNPKFAGLHTHTHRPLFSPQIRPSFVTGRQLIGGRQRLNEFFRSSPPSLCIFLPLRLKYILLATNECR